MKLNKKLFVCGTCLLMLCGMISTTYAANVVNGTSWQKVTVVDIPRGGGVKYNMSYGSKKATSETYASFKKIKLDALLGNYGVLVDSSKKRVSNIVGLHNTSTWSNEYGISKGTTYYSGALSHGLEPSNTCDATYYFSADALD